jgi:hypothetical protein
VEQLSRRSDAHRRLPEPKRPAFLEVLEEQREQNQQNLATGSGREVAKRDAFNALLDCFEREAQARTQQVESW